MLLGNNRYWLAIYDHNLAQFFGNSFNEIAGKPMKTENSMDADDSRGTQTSSEDFVSSQRLKMDNKPVPIHAGKGFGKTLNKRMSQDDSNSLASSKKSNNASAVIIFLS